jgi:hypothetical protein
MIFKRSKEMAMANGFLLLSVTLVLASACLAQDACSHKRSFSGEEEPCFDKAASVTPTIVASILKTDRANDTFPEMEAANPASVSKLLKGVVIHLRDPEQKDMIVRGDFPMSGADNTWFWIVTSIDSRPSALWLQCNAVTILQVRHHGYADIRTDWFAGSHRASRIFRSDGRHYKLFRENYKELPPA